MSQAITPAQRSILRHALGLEGSAAKPEPWRNHYCFEVGGEDNEDIKILIGAGLMHPGRIINDGQAAYAHVTEMGRAVAR